MTNMVFITDGDYYHGTKCPETKLEIKMTETDISKVLIEGDYATIQGVKYKRVEEPKPKKLFDVIRNLGYSVDMCYEIVDAVRCWLPEPQSASGSQNAYVESAVEGYNDCLKEIKDGLG